MPVKTSFFCGYEKGCYHFTFLMPEFFQRSFRRPQLCGCLCSGPSCRTCSWVCRPQAIHTCTQSEMSNAQAEDGLLEALQTIWLSDRWVVFVCLLAFERFVTRTFDFLRQPYGDVWYIYHDSVRRSPSPFTADSSIKGSFLSRRVTPFPGWGDNTSFVYYWTSVACPAAGHSFAHHPGLSLEWGVWKNVLGLGR